MARSASGLVVLGLFAALGAGSARAQYHNLGPASGSTATAISTNGEVAVGWLSGNRNAGWLWTEAGGRVDFGNDAGMPAITKAWGVSGDGGTVVGQANAVGAPRRAYRYKGPGTMQLLGTLAPYSDSLAFAGSMDGSVVVGVAQDSAGFTGRAFRWTQQGGMQSLGYARPSDFYSDAVAVSRDGNTIVGNSRGANSNAFVWTASSGMTVLPPLPDTGFGDTWAWGMNSIGTIVLGESGFNSRAVCWRNGQVVDLGHPVGASSSRAVGCSDDGSVIAGWATYNIGLPVEARIWTTERGAETLQSYLAAQGVFIPDGWTLSTCTGVSADGRTFCGTASGFHQGVAFVVTVPSCGTVPAFVVGAGMTLRRRRRSQMSVGGMLSPLRREHVALVLSTGRPAFPRGGTART